MELPSLSWPVALQAEAEGQDDDYWRIKDGFREGAQSLLLRCMPSNGLPVQNLESVVISGYNIRCVIAAKLPDLEELVISAEGQLKLFFKDVEATAVGQNIVHNLPTAIADRRNGHCQSFACLGRSWPDP